MGSGVEVGPQVNCQISLSAVKQWKSSIILGGVFFSTTSDATMIDVTSASSSIQLERKRNLLREQYVLAQTFQTYIGSPILI